MFITVGLSVLGVLVLAALLNLRAVKSMFSSLGVQLGSLSRFFASKDQVGAYHEKIDAATENLSHAKQGLIKVRGLTTSVNRQVEEGTRESARLDARIKSSLSEGNELKAAEYVKQLQLVKLHLQENKSQLDIHNETYQGLLKQVQVAQEKILSAKNEAERLGTQLEISKAEAELADISQSFTVGSSPLDGLDKYKEQINQKIDQNRAKSKVYSDLNAGTVNEFEEQEKARSEEAKVLLEQYKTDMKSGTK